MQRVVGLLVLAVALFWIIDSPTTAADTVTNVLDLLVYFAGQLVDFIRTLF
jgi:hypothetical protein